MNVVIQFKVSKTKYFCQKTSSCTNMIFGVSRLGAVKPGSLRDWLTDWCHTLVSKAFSTLGDNVDRA